MVKNLNKYELISVITPCLDIVGNNREAYFHKMMESVHSQSWCNIEHIIVDGGSKDGTLDILKKYKEKGWIKYLIVEKDTGIYQAINIGLTLACGDYINVMNTDDFFIRKDVFEKSINTIKKHNVDFTHADKVIKSKEGKPDFIKRGDERVAFFRMPFRHQTMLVKREVFDEIGFFDESYEIASDYKYILRMLLAGKIGCHIPEIFVQSLGGGISSNRQKCIEEVSHVLYECYGKKFNLTLSECRYIYERNIPTLLFIKIFLFVWNRKIRKSLLYGYSQKISLGHS